MNKTFQMKQVKLLHFNTKGIVLPTIKTTLQPSTAALY